MESRANTPSRKVSKGVSKETAQPTYLRVKAEILGDPRGTRTHNPLIKSQLLCQIELAGHVLSG